MARLIVFNHVSIDGYFVDENNDMHWAHATKQDAEWNAFVAENASGNGALAFGRLTYEMMAGFWPSPIAASRDAALADRMNSLRKLVFSRTLDQASWSNTRLVKGEAVEQMRLIKQEPGAPDVAILGSGKLTASMAAAGLIDEFQVVVNPIVLGKGRTMFEGIPGRLGLRLTKSRAFGNGNVLLCYQPAPA